MFVFYIEMREPLSLLYPPPRGEGKTPQMGKGRPPQRGAGKPPKKRTGAPCFSLSVVVGPPPSAVSFPSLTFVTGRSPFVVACPPSSAVSFTSFSFVAGPSPFVVACPSPYVPRPHSLFSIEKIDSPLYEKGFCLPPKGERVTLCTFWRRSFPICI